MLATDARRTISEVNVDDAGCIYDHRLVLANLKFSRSDRCTIESTYHNIWKITFCCSKVLYANLHWFRRLLTPPMHMLTK